MHIYTLATAALMALATALPAAAQNSITLYGGWRGGGSFQQDTSPFESLSLKSSASGSIALDFGLDAMRQVQVFASYQSTDLEATATTPAVALTVGYLHLGGTNYFEGAVGRGAYVVGGLGVTRLSPGLSGLSDEYRPSINLGVGYQWPVTGALSLRAELRGYFTLINSSGGLFCSGGCVVAVKGDGLTQVEGLLGLNLAF
ncbi:MAG: hypothetical protein ACRC4O_04575 [Giesbergeria sp.]